MVDQGLAERYPTKAKKLPPAVVERAAYELEVISNMKFADYFLITWEFCRWSHQQKIVIGPGRGSAAGSIVSYALRITNIDPLKYDLPFERFLNPERISMPDIDIDIEDGRRDEVIDHVIAEYGQERVAHILTFGQMAARSAFKDVARVLEMPYIEADRLSKLIPPPKQGRHTPLKTHLETDKQLQAEYQKTPETKRAFDLATRLEGTIRNHGVHAAGVVIAPDKIVKYTPLEVSPKGVITTQYSMEPIEDLGLLKMDFLGLSNLTIIKNACRIIRKVYNQEIDINDIPLDDQKTLELLSQGDTTGVFQLESGGMREYLKRLRPTEFEDIAAMVALYRPGPLNAGLTDSFINRKHGREKVEVPHPAFAPALEGTYGTMVYQEQVMRIARDVCGFSGAEADSLRKAIGKKIHAQMVKLKDRFVEGGVSQTKVDRQLMEKVWGDIVGFADYAFNRSHSVSYGLIAYQTAYLKANYRPALMAALMTADAGDNDRLRQEIAECQNKGIEVLAPDVNESFLEFGVIKTDQSPAKIRVSLGAIKNVGTGVVEKIIEERDKNGAYTSLDNFVGRLAGQGIFNRKTLESFIQAGVLDRFADRNQLLAVLDSLSGVLSSRQAAVAKNQVGLFGTKELPTSHPDIELPEVESASPAQKLAWERDLLGIYVSAHPLDDLAQTISQPPFTALADLSDKAGQVQVAGVLVSVKQKQTKTGKAMAIVQLEDLSSSRELVVFPNVYEQNQAIYQQDQIVQLTLKSETTDRHGQQLEQVNWLVMEGRLLLPGSQSQLTTPADPAGDSKPVERLNPGRSLYIKLAPTDQDELQAVKSALQSHTGRQAVKLIVGEGDDLQILDWRDHGVEICDELITVLEGFGAVEQVEVRV